MMLFVYQFYTSGNFAEFLIFIYFALSSSQSLNPERNMVKKHAGVA